MADDIKGVLTDILKAGNSVEQLKKSLTDLGNVKAGIEITGANMKDIRNMEKMIVAVKSLERAQADLNKVEEAAAKAMTGTAEEREKATKIMDETREAYEKQGKQVKELAVSEAKRHDEITKQALDEKETIINQFKQNTLLGKSYAALSGPLGKFAAGLTAGSLALKAVSRFTDAAKLRNDMMIASYGKLDDNLGSAVMGTLDYESSMRQAESAAIRYGMANENVADMMIRYQRIVGESTPEAVGSLTEATLAMAKVMGITGAQALDYVQARMDNFGGTAADALKELDNLREGTVKYNTTLQGVRIRGDDVVRTIQDITNSNGAYAVDQRFLSQILMRTSATLQAQGESYNFAQKQAENFSKALTSEAPEWMQITNAFDIADDVNSNIDELATKKNGFKTLTESYAEELDKAKPGLSKKVQDLLNAGYSEYDTTRLLGETLKDTEIGMKLMSGKIVEIGESGISTLASVYGKSWTDAESMFKSATKTVELERLKKSYVIGTGKELTKSEILLRKTLKISDEMVKKARTDIGLRKSMLESQAEEISMAKTGVIIQKQKADAAAKRNKAETYMIEQEKALQELKEKGASEGDITQATKNYEEARKHYIAMKAEVSDDAAGDMGIIGRLTAKVDAFQQSTGLLTGAWLKATLNEYSSPLVMAVGAGALFMVKGLGGKVSNIESILDGKIYDVLTNIATKTDGSDNNRGGKPRKRTMGDRARSLKKTFNRKGPGGGFRGVTKNIMQNTKGAWKGMGGMGKNLIRGGGLLTAGIGAVDVYQQYKEKGVKGAAKSIVSSGSTIAGSAIGAALGTALLPGIGTVIGGALGGMAGGALGDMAGNMYDKFTSDPKQIQAKLAPQAPHAAIINPGAIPADKQASAGMSGATGDLGTLNSDGSVTLTINNFMDTYVQAISMAKKSGVRG